MTNEIDTSNTVGPGQAALFPWKLYEMLDGAETHGYTSIVSWSRMKFPLKFMIKKHSLHICRNILNKPSTNRSSDN